MSENNIICYEFDGFKLDITNFQLLENGENISLTQKSFELLQYLLENQGKILKKETLLDSLWEGNFVEEANLTQHIYMLRKALKQKERKIVYIETIPKNGYRFLAEVSVISEEDLKHSVTEKEKDANERLDYLNLDFENSFIKKEIETSKEFSSNIDKTQSKSLSFVSVKPLAMLSLLGFLFFVGTFFYYSNIYGEAKVTKKIKNFAVLPFKQIDGEKDEKLGIGVADVTIARLSNIEEISVTPTTSIMSFDNQENSDLQAVGKKLDTDYIIAGTIQKDNQNVRITTQLYGVKEKKQIWNETFDEEYSDIFSLQDSISEKVANKVLMGLDFRSSALPYRQYTRNIEAYQAYSLGLSYWNKHTQKAFENAIREFNKAIDIDPQFTLAYAYLADTYAHTNHIGSLIAVDKARKTGKQWQKELLS